MPPWWILPGLGLTAEGLRLLETRRYLRLGGVVAEGNNLCGKNKKGCDFGYAPAANSCEGVNNPDTCTVTALDAISAFAEPDPGCSSQSPPVFSGPATYRVAPAGGSPSLLRISESFKLPTLSAVDESEITTG